jgi:hypothetical protein
MQNRKEASQDDQAATRLWLLDRSKYWGEIYPALPADTLHRLAIEDYLCAFYPIPPMQ